MKTLFKRFAKDDSGVTAIEYGLIAALVAVGLIVGATALGNGLNTSSPTSRPDEGLADRLETSRGSAGHSVGGARWGGGRRPERLATAAPRRRATAEFDRLKE